MNHCEQVLALLRVQIGRDDEVTDIHTTAGEVAKKWVDPASGGKEETNGLIYGLVQSGKTGVLTVTGAIAADTGYKTILILTSDIDPLYLQTFGRIQEAFPGMDVLGKADIRDDASLVKRLRGATCAIVMTKNGRLLATLVEALKKGNVRGLSCVIIDDEADQASLNTKASHASGSVSPINQRIAELRRFFHKNTYVQVTATPQALFLQDPTHAFRPKFTVLSEPGRAYVGGADFFSDGSSLVKEFPLNDITALTGGAQPMASLRLPTSLLQALDMFMVGATFKRSSNPNDNCAFLCHVSTKTSDHRYIVQLLQQYRLELIDATRTNHAATRARLRAAYDELCSTSTNLASMPFDDIIKSLTFLAPGAAVKLVNGETDEDVAVRAPYNLFVGGNKLGRGVTIKNLLVSYYGRNPRKPQADTVLQHARMYGYRRGDLGLLRLFLPPELHAVFRAIDRMETSLRDLIQREPSEEFRGVYVQDPVSATRRNVLVPGAIGTYTGGGTYNPAQVLRDASIAKATKFIDDALRTVGDKQWVEMPMDKVREIIEHTRPDPAASEHVWNAHAVAGSITQYAKLLNQQTAYVYVDRGRRLRESRRETQGILDGGEAGTVPPDKLTLFMLRLLPGQGEHDAWWPQIRFPAGRYALAFAV
jgi:hypothetical protein